MCAASFKLSSYRSGSNPSYRKMHACVYSTCQNVCWTDGHWTLPKISCKSYLDPWWVEYGWSALMLSTVFDFTCHKLSYPWEMTSASRAMAPTAHASLWVWAEAAEACAEVCCSTGSTALGYPPLRCRTLQGGAVGKPGGSGSAVPGPCL